MIIKIKIKNLFSPCPTIWSFALLFSLILSLMKLVYMVSAHSMEEAEFLCDRLGFFVDGSLQCIGNPKEVPQ